MKKSFAKVLKLFVLTALISSLMLLAASAANVVFLKDGGTGDGSSPENAVGTLTKAHNALDLTADDATIVVCGPYTQSVNWVYSGGEYTGTVTFTSVYGGVDYRETAGAVYNIGKVRFLCLGNNKFENLNFNCTAEYCLMIGQHYAVTLGDGVEISGDKLVGAKVANSFTVIGGYQGGTSLAVNESTADTNITVLSGSNIYVIPYSRDIAGGKFTGTANITLGGDAKVSVLHGSGASADSTEFGNVNITLKDNAVVNNFYGCTDNVTVASYTLNYRGGSIESFNWVCPNTPDKVLTVTGDKKLIATSGVDFSVLIDEFDIVEGTNVVFVKDGGTGDGSNAANAVDSLEAAYAKLNLKEDCTVVICGPFTQSTDFNLGRIYSGTVTLTSVYGGVDYRTAAGANWQFSSKRMACYGDTIFENIDFVALSGFYRLSARHCPLVFGEGITVTGDSLLGTTTANSFTIIGGYDKAIGTYKTSDASSINVTVLSGTNLYVVPFSYNITGGVYNGTANITIGGTADLGTLHGSAAYPDGVKIGKVKVTLTDNCVVRRFYGCTHSTIADGYEFIWESGSIRNFKWKNDDGKSFVVNSNTVLRVTDKAAATMFYEGVAGNFDTVIGAPHVATEVVPAKITSAVKSYINKYTNGRKYMAVDFTALGDALTQISLKIPSGGRDGYLYHYDGTDIEEVSAHNIGNGLIGFDLEKTGVYFSLETPLFTMGDLNYDGNISVIDTLLVLRLILGDTDIDSEWADISGDGEVTLIDALRQLKAAVGEPMPEPERVFDPDDYNVISVERYLDKTKLGFLSQIVGFLSGYEFARDPETNSPMIAMPDSYFEMCNGAYADPKEFNLHGDKHLLNEETGIWEVWNDDDFSIDILDQYILRDTYEKYGTMNSKVITDDWIAYDVYDMGGGNRDIGAYGLMKSYQYLSVFAGNTEMCNNFNVNGEPYIGNETLGMNTPGMPDLAVELAHKFGSVTSDRDPLEWLRMIAAMYSMAYFEDDIPTLIRTAQSATMTKGSWPYHVVDKCFELYEKYPDNWRDAIIEADKIFRSYNYDNPSYMGCTSINCSFIILGLLYGDGDYYNTCKIISLAGHGGDSTTPTALGIVGVICGWSHLDETSKTIINEKVWQDGNGVIVNRPLDPEGSYGVWMHLAGLDERFNIKDIIYMYQDNFENILYENGGFELDGNYYIPKQTISHVDTVYAEHFENGGISSYSVSGGTVQNPSDPFMGANGLELTAAASGDSVAYTKVSGFTVGETYKLSAFIRTADGVTAHMFAREQGAGIESFVTVHDSNVYVKRFTVGEGENNMCSYVKRDLVFTATKETMEIGLMLPAGTVSGGSAAIDAVQITRFTEAKKADVTVSGAKNENGAYNGLIRFEIDGGCEKEVWLKLTYSSNATELEKAITLVNRAWQSRTPIVPTNGGNVTIYIPVLVNDAESNLVTIYVGDTDVTVHEAALVSVPQF